jgi:protein involved in polysaccharide export with SLBB domain/capsular polysaccharide biosynthesis protein
MNHDYDSDAGPLRKRDEFRDDQAFRNERPNAGARNGHSQSSGKVDAWTFLDLFISRWHWVVLTGLLFTGVFFYLGSKVIGPKFTANAQLLRYETPMGESFRAPSMTAETFSGVIRSPDLLRRVAEKAFQEHHITPLPPEKLTKLIKIEPEPDSDLVKVSLAERTESKAVDLLNVYLVEAVAFTTELQKQQADKVARAYLREQVDRMSKDIETLHKEFRNMALVPDVTNQLSEVSKSLDAMSGGLAIPGRQAFQVGEYSRRLQSAMTELSDLLVEYTEIHPRVIAKSNEVASLQRRLRDISTNSAAAGVSMAGGAMPLLAPSRPGEAPFNPELDIVRTKLLSLEQGRVDLANRYHEAELFAANPPGVVRVFAPADLKTVQSNMRWIKVGIVGLFGGFLGVIASLALVLLVEFVDTRVKTIDDLKRVTRLPVLTSLGNLHEMTPESRSQWAFRTWTLLQGRLSPSANHGLVCGITSSEKGEGRSTWIRLLADAASLTGFRVLTIATRPSPSHKAGEEQKNQKPPETPGEEPRSADKRTREDKDMKDTSQTPSESVINKGAANGRGSSALTTNVLTSPMQVTEQLTGPNSQPMVHIPLPGWVWNLERRKQWGEALSHWRTIDNLVILVELPPASVPEAVLLGSNLPNIVWLSDSGRADAAEIRAQIQTLRDARCNLVGAVLNREGAPSVKRRFSRWLGCIAFIGLISLASGAQAQPAAQSAETPPSSVLQQPAAEDALDQRRPGSFSIIHPSQRAAWQKRLTLGPGDVLTVGLFGAPELTRAEVVVGPDGRISFLEAHDIQAAGLTIDELRGRLDEALGQYRRAARSIVTPLSFRSKKYFILGRVMTKGVYTLDRPMTVLEAIARAKGLESGLVDRNVVDVADVQHAFLARGGKRIPLDFEKLFLEGDLSQNIAIEPGDYIYFPPSDVQEVYVVGEVRLPGTVTYTRNLTIMGAISSRGGYSERAYKMKVMVVRGSINNPEAIVVDTHAIIDGREPDFQLKPRDIIFVNSRPFIRVEELADTAATAFLQSLITSWVGIDVISPVGD